MRKSGCIKFDNSVTQRKLDGEDYDDYEAGVYNVDYDECQKECKKLDQSGLSDEVNYLDCQQAYEDEGLQIYSGVAYGDGNFITGTFYDDECTFGYSTSQAYFDFTYEGFQSASTVLNDGGRDEAKKICCMFKTNKLMRFHTMYKFNWAFTG
eukprot:180856-Ditylum_brightwellii.AAC.1